MGMTHGQAMRLVIMPQAVRLVIPSGDPVVARSRTRPWATWSLYRMMKQATNLAGKHQAVAPGVRGGQLIYIVIIG